MKRKRTFWSTQHATDTCLLVEEDERQHRPAQAPLVGAVLEQRDLEQRREDVREQLRPLPQVLADRLRMEQSSSQRVRTSICRSWIRQWTQQALTRDDVVHTSPA